MTLAPAPVCPHFTDMEETKAILRKVLDAIPTSTRALAQEAGVSEKLLRMIRDGDRRLTSDVRAKLVEALRTWETDCGNAADALEAVNPQREAEGE